MKRYIKATSRKFLKATKRILSGNGLDWLPIRGPLLRYNKEKFGYDSKAALNVALLALPQGMAYAAIAELPICFLLNGSSISFRFCSSRISLLNL